MATLHFTGSLLSRGRDGRRRGRDLLAVYPDGLPRNCPRVERERLYFLKKINDRKLQLFGLNGLENCLEDNSKAFTRLATAVKHKSCLP